MQALTDARQNTRQYRFLMEKSDNVVEDAIFISREDAKHPQKLAHAALLDFHEEVNQPEYTVKMDDLWQENLTRENGREITIAVPKHDTVEKTVSDSTGIENILPAREEIETTDEKVSLETLSHRWSGRTVDVEVTEDSPYYNRQNRVETVRLWLPPKAIKAAYSQLNGALSKIGLLAQTSAPVEHDPDPI